MLAKRLPAACLTAWLATALLTACQNDGGKRAMPPGEVVTAGPAVVETISDRSQELWLETRRESLAASEAQVAVLARARQELQGRRLGIQRDAAICFQARHLMDKDLRVAMQAGGEFGPALDRWHTQARGVETFCAYALTVGAPK